ncbi:MAG: dTDP-glucose 4,6-dehydratase [Candidatus Margulisiibacteriota bacterium]|jgi:dTDP-glucose 4,6-dehydratase
MFKKTILVTGGLGFIGSNFVPYYVNKYPDHLLINLDSLTYAGNLDNVTEIKDSKNYQFIKGDITDFSLVERIFQDFTIDAVIHFAAESHVDNSILGPAIFVKTNLMGTFNLLEAARKTWLEEPFKYKQKYENARFHHISTDEVYGSLGAEGYFTEQTPYAPNSPYSASKAGSDFLVRSYHHTYGMNTVITNCSNNYGPKQHNEKLIPTIIRKAIAKEPIPIYGDGKNIRDWLFVLDHIKALVCVFNQGLSGETYNIGGNAEKTNLEVVAAICEILDQLKPLSGKSYKEFITFVKDRPGHDKRYAIDASKIKSKLNWQPEHTFDQGILETIQWYLNKYL